MNPEDGISLFFNSLLHSIILFSILSALYILVIVKMVENGFKTQISASVERGVNPVLDDMPKETIIHPFFIALDKRTTISHIQNIESPLMSHSPTPLVLDGSTGIVPVW